MLRKSIVLLAAGLATVVFVRPLRAQDSERDFGDHVFEGEPANGRPLEGVPDESRKMEARPSESRPLDVPVEGRVTDSQANDGPTVEQAPRELIPEDDGSSANGSLRNAEPADNGGDVEPGPSVEEQTRHEDGYGH